MIGILIDVTRCTGCGECIQACVEANDLGGEKYLPQNRSDGLSASRWTTVVQSPEGRSVRKVCRHCLEPACVSVCPVGAMSRTSEGAVIYDPKLCMGCRYCMMACPYGIPRYEWDSAAPLVKKCTLCYGRLQQGLIPSCVERCPHDAMIFGDRDKLLQDARNTLAAAPDRYQPIIYGEHDAGGSAVMYISDIPLDFLAFHDGAGSSPLPELSWNWLGKVPGVTTATAGLMTGLFWVIGRRMQAEESKHRKSNPSYGGADHE